MLFRQRKSIPVSPIITRQLEQKDCGVACLLSIIRHYGGHNNFENLRRLSGTSVTGTTLLGLYQAAQATGFEAEGCEADMNALLEHNDPCILHVLLENNLHHYVVYYGKMEKMGMQYLIIGDPAKGIIYMKPAELEII